MARQKTNGQNQRLIELDNWWIRLIGKIAPNAQHQAPSWAVACMHLLGTGLTAAGEPLNHTLFEPHRCWKRDLFNLLADRIRNATTLVNAIALRQ